MVFSTKFTVFLLIFVLILAAFFRLWQLDSIPPGLYPDEAINANTAAQALETKSFKVFYPENHGREGLYMNLTALVFWIAGISIFSFKLVSALAGILTVWGVYLLSGELLRRLAYPLQKVRLASLFASFLLAISFWHINFSRIGFRAILAPLALVFSSYFLFRGFRTKKLLDFVIAGLIFGAGFHTYISFRPAILAFGFTILMWLFLKAREKKISSALFAISILFVFAFIAALPIGLYFLGHPEDFISRASGVSIFQNPEPLKALGASFIKHLGMFHFYGDPNWRHNFSGTPQLSLLAGIFFLIALAGVSKTAFAHITKGVAHFLQKEVLDFFLVWSFLGLWLFALLLPGILTFEGIPHSLRTIGVIPVVYIMAGLGGHNFFSWLAQTTSRIKLTPVIPVIIIALIVGGLTIQAWYGYFIAWAQHPKVEEAFTRRFVDVGNYLNTLPETTKAYVIQSEGNLPAQVPIFIQRAAGKNNAVYIEKNAAAYIAAQPGEIILTMNKERDVLQPIIQKFPSGELIELERFWAYKIVTSNE